MCCFSYIIHTRELVYKLMYTMSRKLPQQLEDDQNPSVLSQVLAVLRQLNLQHATTTPTHSYKLQHYFVCDIEGCAKQDDGV